MEINNLKNYIINICENIYKTLGSGYPEIIYQRALELELRIKNEVHYSSQHLAPIYYLGHYLGYGFVDLLIDKKLILELKSQKTKLNEKEETQIKNYMKNLKINDGLIINFNGEELEIKEIREEDGNTQTG